MDKNKLIKIAVREIQDLETLAKNLSDKIDNVKSLIELLQEDSQQSIVDSQQSIADSQQSIVDSQQSIADADKAIESEDNLPEKVEIIEEKPAETAPVIEEKAIPVIIEEEKPEIVIEEEKSEIIVEEKPETVVEEKPEIIVEEKSEIIIEEKSEIIIEEKPETVVEEKSEIIIEEKSEIIIEEKPEIIVEQEKPAPIVEKKLEMPKKNILADTLKTTSVSLNEKMSEKANISLDKALSNQKITDLKRSISLNDKFRFQREIFAGNAALLNQTLEALNEMESSEEAAEFLSNLNLDNDNQVVMEFLEFINRRF